MKKSESLLWRITHYYPTNKEASLIITIMVGTALLSFALIGIATLPKIQASLSATPLPTIEPTRTITPTTTPYLTPTITPTPTATSYKSNIIYMREDGGYYVRKTNGCITPPIWGGDVTVGAQAVGDPNTIEDGWPMTVKSLSNENTFDDIQQLKNANIGSRWSEVCPVK